MRIDDCGLNSVRANLLFTSFNRQSSTLISQTLHNKSLHNDRVILPAEAEAVAHDDIALGGAGLVGT